MTRGGPAQDPGEPASPPGRPLDEEIAALSFEEAVAELEHAVAQLGREQEDLELAVRTYERGLALARRCARLLKEAQARLDRITQPDEVP